jgi:hypothetical protein
MKDEAQASKRRATTLSVAALVAALAAFVAFAPFASGAADPVASGSTTITLNKGLFKKLKKAHVKVAAVKPGKVKGKKITLQIEGATSSLDPTTGAGTLNHKGGFKFKAGKKSVVIKSLTLDTVKKGLFGKVGKKKIKIAAVAGASFKREGFGAGIIAKKLNLTKKAAKTLNKQLKLKNVFKPNKSLGSANSSEQPETVTITGGSATLTTDVGTVTKLVKDHVGIELVPPTTEPSKLPPVYVFPISGGSIAPDASKGVVQTSGGLKLVQDWSEPPPKGCATPIKTTLTLNAIWVDLGTHVATVEVVVESTVPEANLGVLGRSSIADVNTAGAGVASDPASHTVTVTNASATLQAVTAETLNSLFFKAAKTFEEKGCPGVEAQEFKAGDPLGSFSFTAQTQ